MKASGQGRRQKRVANLLKDELSRVFIQEVQPLVSSLITVTRVEMPADLRTAKVYVTVLGDAAPDKVLRLPEQRTGYFRKILASTVNLKYNPELFFVLDPVPAYEFTIDRLIAKIKKDGQGHD